MRYSLDDWSGKRFFDSTTFKIRGADGIVRVFHRIFKVSKYESHQGEREKARRRRQVQKGG